MLRTSADGPSFTVRDGEWVAERLGGAVATIAEVPHAFLCLLELPREVAVTRVRAAAEAMNVAPHSLPPLPYAEAILAGMSSESEYWQRLALDRLAERGDGDGDGNGARFLDELKRLEVAGSTQDVRHRARRMAS